MKNLLRLVVLVSLAGVLGRAQDLSPSIATGVESISRISRVDWDEPGDGRIWAITGAYKASFGAEGATYVPFFGSSAPQNYPIAFQLAALTAGGEPIAFDCAAPPVRDGNRITFDRGGVLEVYDLTPETVEQSFVFQTPLQGAIEIDMGVHTELARSRDGSELLLSNDLGTVRYGTAYAIDDRIGRTELASAWSAGSIRIAVPAERVSEASWPLVVDPVLSSSYVDVQTDEDILPDVAYDPFTARWLVVYERVFSATDHDVYYHLMSFITSSLDEGYIDGTSTYWASPKVAWNVASGNFLTVAAVGSPTGGARIIRGRMRSAGNGAAVGAAFTISGETGDKHSPDVGGNPSTVAGSSWCIAWQRDASGTDADIHARMVTSGGSVVGPVILVASTAGTLDRRPSVSKSCGKLIAGSPPVWNLAWHRFTGSFDNDLRGAQIGASGLVVTPAFYIDSGSSNTYYASASSPTDDVERTWMVVSRRQASQSGLLHTYGWVLRGSQIIQASVNLSSLAGAPLTEQQYDPSVDCDGALFVVTDQETDGTADTNPYISTFHVIGNRVHLAEGHQHLSLAGGEDSNVEITCLASSGGQARRTTAVWRAGTSGGFGNIAIGAYEAVEHAPFCGPGSDGVISCPCGNPPVGSDRGCDNSANMGGGMLRASGFVSPADNIRLVATDLPPNAICLFVQGTAVVQAGQGFGDGVRCVGGFFLRLAVKTAANGGVVYPTNEETPITQRSAEMGAPIAPGTDRYYFVYYRDAMSYACPTTFNATNSVRVRW